MGLDTVELVMSFEEEFGIAIPNEVAENLVRVRDVVDYVERTLRQEGRATSRGDIFDRVRKRTVEISNVAPAKIGLDTHFIEDLNLD